MVSTDRMTLAGARLGALLLMGVTWIIPAYNKLTGPGVPEGFRERFANTFLAQVPGIPASFYLIAILEAVAGLLAVASLLRLEFLPERPAPILRWLLLLSILIFVKLGFGLRLSGDNAGAASLFTYTAGTFVILGVLMYLEDRSRLPAE